MQTPLEQKEQGESGSFCVQSPSPVQLLPQPAGGRAMSAPKYTEKTTNKSNIENLILLW
jgi:hypothetical protein